MIHFVVAKLAFRGALCSGYQLGELNEWSKKTNTEWATHVPLLIRVPWIKSSIGKRCRALVELVDL